MQFTDDGTVEIQFFCVTPGSDHFIDLIQHLIKGECVFFQNDLAGVNIIHVQHVADHTHQLFRTVSDFFQLQAGFRLQIGIFECDAVHANDGIHRSPHLMAHAGKQGGLDFGAFPGCIQLGFQMFFFLYTVSNELQPAENDKHEDAAAEKYPGNDQIRFAEKTNGQITEQKCYQQENRNVEFVPLFSPVSQFLEMPGILDIAVYIIDHQGTAQIDHAVYQPVHSSIIPPEKYK